MKILWLTNYPLPRIAEKVGLPITVNEGWLIGLSENLMSQGCNLVFCTVIDGSQRELYYQDEKYVFYGIPNKQNRVYNDQVQWKMKKVLETELPDIIHIMGTEFPHSYSMWKACQKCGMDNRCVVSIQGLISKIALAYDAGIEEKNKKKRLLWDILVKDSILKNKEDFINRGKCETKLLSEIKNIIGRTEWDLLCVRELNQTAKYFKCNETLRAVFYRNEWKYEKCEKHSIIISQATYPVKGFHTLLKAAAQLKRTYTDLKIYVPSQTCYPNAMKRSKWLNNDYANYIVSLIKENKLENNIIFLGSLDAENMCKAYLNSNVFVCPSTIENSSNSLGEAMLLGMPIVASYVGGLPSMMEHDKEGYFFPYNQPYTLAGYIDMLFQNSYRAIELGKNAKARAITTHNPTSNVRELLKCYQEIYRG